jgi:hypothetical protein
VSAGGTAGKKGNGAGGTVSPVSCPPSSDEAGATSSGGEADAPLFHRAAPACCPALRGPAPPANVASGTPYGPDCSSDAVCTEGANGRCFPDEGLVMESGCSYDKCFTDSQCPSLSACHCRDSAADSTPNVCLPVGTCTVDADCGLGGYCSPSPSPPAGIVPGCGYPNFAYYCHTKKDTCTNASDCPIPEPSQIGIELFPVCVYDPALQHWGCDQSACLPP